MRPLRSTAVGGADYKEPAFGAVVELREELVHFAGDIVVVGALSLRYHCVKFVEAEHHRLLGFCLLEQVGNHPLRAVDVDACEVGGFDKRVVEACLLGKFLGKECFAASRRTVEEHSVWRCDFIFFGFFFVFEHEYHLLVEHLLERFHAGYVFESIAVAGGDAEIFCRVGRCC